MIPCVLFAQSIERQVIGSTGSYSSNSTARVSSTVGETVITTASSGNIILTQGFQQKGGNTIGINELENGFSINAYPNPVSNELILDFDVKKKTYVEIFLTDVMGKETSVPSGNLELSGKTTHVMNLSDISAGHYLLTFKTVDQILGTIKI